MSCRETAKGDLTLAPHCLCRIKIQFKISEERHFIMERCPLADIFNRLGYLLRCFLYYFVENS